MSGSVVGGTSFSGGVPRARKKAVAASGGCSFAEIKRARFIPQPSGSFYSIRDATAEIADTHRAAHPRPLIPP